MNILFLTLLDFDSIEERGIYTDLIREFVKNNNCVCIISPTEKKKNQSTRLIDNGNHKILKLQIGNMQKTNIFEKGISTVTLESKFMNGIKKYFSNEKFDLIIYSTPPITLYKAVRYVKERDQSKTYLLLKDIFPQNAVDLGMLSKSGIKGLLYKYYRVKEKKLYQISDFIGCMSPANVDYILKNNPEIDVNKVEVCPNSIEPVVMDKNPICIEQTKNKFNIPLNKTIFIYGGNIGKPQGIDFLIDCIRSNENNDCSYFIIVGSGTEFTRLKTFFDTEKPRNAQLHAQLPRDEYENLTNACDVGLIFLDSRFTIPNFPSRILSYMQASIPILAATDINTDLGKIITEGGFGWWCESNSIETFVYMTFSARSSNKLAMGSLGYTYLNEQYTVGKSYRIIMENLE